jgi:hypothetical protein
MWTSIGTPTPRTPFPRSSASALVAKLVKMPIRAYHGTRDSLAPMSNDESPINQLRTLGGTARLVKTNSSHDCQDVAFADPTLFEWCHDQRRSHTAR